MKQFPQIQSQDGSFELPPLQQIQHQIDLFLWANLPNLPHYRMSLNEVESLQSIVNYLLTKQLI